MLLGLPSSGVAAYWGLFLQLCEFPPVVLVGLFLLGLANSFGLGEIVHLIGHLEPHVGNLGEL